MNIKMMRDEMQDVLQNNILHFWQTKMVDRENGGFYGRIDAQGMLHPEAEKGAILNARILWSFSAAYRVLGLPEYLEMATYAKDYFLEHFIDKEYGGVYWSVDAKGRPLNTRKQFYALGFALYGLSEYARATGHAFDKQFNGYIEATTREWKPIADMRLSELDANFPKSQNTHLHIIEPYTNLYRCLKEMQDAMSCDYVPVLGSVLPIGVSVPMETVISVEASLRNLIDIFTDRILNPETHHLDLFFEMDWTRGAGHLESYGHDIECSWLMHEAALVLGDQKVLRKVEQVVREVATASEKGLRSDGSMIHEANKAVRCWEYIKTQLIDYENGEWFWSRHPDGTLNTVDDKAGFWKCPYHNSRMCLEIIERTDSDTLQN